MFLHYKCLELNSSFTPSSPDCWCRWRNVVSGSRRLWTSVWDFFWKVLRVANQAQRMTSLSVSTMPDRYCDEHAKACLWEIERPMSGRRSKLPQQWHISNFQRPRLHYESLHLPLTGSKRGCGNLYLAVGQVRLEGRQWGGGGRLSREELRRLGACWARAGAVTSDMRLLFVKHCHQLQRETQRQKEVFTFKRMKL